jgi:hypothetical protein
LRQLLCHLIRLLAVFEVTLPPFDLVDIAELLQRLFRFVRVLFFVRQKVDLRGVVLEDVCDDAVAKLSRL